MSPPVPPLLSVLPSRALVDEEVKVLVENLPPGSPVTLHSLHQSEDRDYWEAYGHYISDARGAVTVAEDLSFGGTYTGREPMGLFWSMRPVPGSREGLSDGSDGSDGGSLLQVTSDSHSPRVCSPVRLRKMKVCSPLLVHVSVYDGHVSEGFRKQRPLASALTERWYVAPGVQRISVTERGVRGTLFIPPGPGPFPGLLDMWGAGGGLIEYRSSLLASHGYASLALEYFAASEMESANIEFSYFETAFSIVRDHPQVMADRVGILGLSLGTAVAILLAAESSAVKPRCCVCISGSHFYPPGATLKDIFHILVRNAPKIRVDEDNCEIWRDMVLPITEDFSLKVDAGKIKCPMLLLNGLDDQNWPTVECAEDMAQMMRAAGKEHLLTRLSYPDTGHLIEPPFSPHCRASRFIRDRTREKAMLLWGGRTKPHSDAQQDAWRKILAFLQRHLYRRPRM